MFDLSLTKIAVLLVIAVVIFGPDQLPKVAAQAARTLRELRRLADGARRDLTEGLGPESPYGAETPYGAAQQSTATLAPGVSPPWDSEAT